MPEKGERQPATSRRGNVQPGGRYGSAPDDKRHVAPEVPPLGAEDVEAHVPDAMPGALPENAAEPTDEDERKG